jgi:hypothetical protein
MISLMWQGLVCFAIVIGIMASAFSALMWFFIRRQDKAEGRCRQENSDLRTEFAAFRERSYAKDMKTLGIMGRIEMKLGKLKDAVEDAEPNEVSADSESDLHRSLAVMQANEAHDHATAPTGEKDTTKVVKRDQYHA